MEYLEWNNLLSKQYFNTSNAGREVLLYVNKEIIDKTGAPSGVGTDEFIKSVIKGPEWARSERFCDRAFEAYRNWRSRDLEYPPYISYLLFFVLAGGTETSYASHSYYPGLRKLLGQPQGAGRPYHFDFMESLWDDLEKWSREERHEELGRFVARIRGGWRHVGLPRSQTVLSESERKQLPEIFHNLGFDPLDPPAPENIEKALYYYRQEYLENRTRKLLESTVKKHKALKRALVELVLDELEAWDGTVLEPAGREELQEGRTNVSLRLCIKIDKFAGLAKTYVRFKTGKELPDDLYFRSQDDETLWQCLELQHGWSTALKNLDSIPPAKLDGALLDWEFGDYLTDPDAHWRARLRKAAVRVFRLNIDGLPDWIETQRLERGISFLIACKRAYGERIVAWGEDGCESLDKKTVTGLPPGWILFSGKNATTSCPGIDILTLSSTVRLRLSGGIKTGSGNAYFTFAPPQIVLENGLGSETVYLNGKPLKKINENDNTYDFPDNLTSGLPLRIYTEVDNQMLSKVIRLEDFDLAESFNDTPVRDRIGKISREEIPDFACGAGVECCIDPGAYNGPDLKYLADKIVLIGQVPGQVCYLPDEDCPSAWKPAWIAAKRSRKKWQLLFCGNSEQAESMSSLPKPAGNKRRIKQWKEAVYHRRRQYQLPAIRYIQNIWKNFTGLAKNV